MWPFRQRSTAGDVAGGLRDLALAPPAAGALARESAGAFVAVLEFRVGKAVVTLASFADGTTGLYFSTGGGMIGGGELPAVRAAAARFRSIAERSVAAMRPADATPRPRAGSARFYVRTADGLLTRKRRRSICSAGATPSRICSSQAAT